MEEHSRLLADWLAQSVRGDVSPGALEPPLAALDEGIGHISLVLLLRGDKRCEFLLSRNLAPAAAAAAAAAPTLPESDWQLADTGSLPLVAKVIASARPLRCVTAQGGHVPDLAATQAAAALGAPAAATDPALIVWPLPGPCLGAVLVGCSRRCAVDAAELARSTANQLVGRHLQQLLELRDVIEMRVTGGAPSGGIRDDGGSGGYSSSSDSGSDGSSEEEEEAETSARGASRAAMAQLPVRPAAPVAPSSPAPPPLGLWEGMHPALLRFRDPAREAAWEAWQSRGALQLDATLYLLMTTFRVLEFWVVPCLVLASRLPAWKLAVGMAGPLAVWPLLHLAPAMYLRHRQAVVLLWNIWNSVWFVLARNHEGLCSGVFMHKFFFVKRMWIGANCLLMPMLPWRWTAPVSLGMLAYSLAGVPPPACAAPGAWRGAACGASVLHTVATTVMLPLGYMWIVELRGRRMFAAQYQQQQGQQWQQQLEGVPERPSPPSQPSGSGLVAAAAERSLAHRTWASGVRAVA